MLAWLLSLLLLLLLLRGASQRGTSFSPPACGACRHPMAAVRGISTIFCQQLRPALVTLDEIQHHNLGDDSDEGSPPRTS